MRKEIREFNAEQARIMQSARTSLKTLNATCERGQAIVSWTLEDAALYPAIPELYDGLAMLQAKILIEQKRELERETVVSYLTQSALWDARLTGPDSPATTNRLRKLSKFASRKGDIHDYSIERTDSGDYTVV